MTTDKYDVVIVGTGFAASFFLKKYLERGSPDARILVLERGEMNTHRAQLNDGLGKKIRRESQNAFINRTPAKNWIYTISFGGGSNCWVGCTPRMLPEDMKLKSTYGVGEDWPISYDELESYYSEAEEIMLISGPEDAPFPRSRPYPQPAHRFTDVDLLFKKAYPDQFFNQPTARPSRGTPKRPRCCMSGVCQLCPIDSKFTILNELSHLYDDKRVTLMLGARVDRVEIEGGQAAKGVTYEQGGALHEAKGDLIVLGANAIFNPKILLSSGLEHPELGAGLVEQVSKNAIVHLDGVDNFQGSTYVTGHGYMLYSGSHRSDRAAAVIETYSKPELRMERGKWRQLVRLRIIYEDLRRKENRVRISEDDPTKPEVFYDGHSGYTQRAIDTLDEDLPRLLAPLPVEKIMIDRKPNSTEAHILGTTPMGDDPASSVVDRNLVHHQVRNLLVLGSSVYPTASPINPTLTLSALALRAADYVSGSPALV